ncbi:serine hydrolase domain-containing protein [Camelliibacillus cellulosilyticus]|uniref:Serine hydrolase domain-containing protein n=1 Tax=Camelliibacillus cellulosilyticus TaxID=2174486 RepID=A0ABV9GQK2_9BACL
MGLSTSRHLADIISESLETAISNGVFSGGVATIIENLGNALTIAKGKTSSIDESPAIEANTLFDLASLTKVVATTPSILMSIQKGRLSLSDRVIDLIPELKQDKAGMTIAHLLTHTSGLPAWRPLFINHHGSESYIKAIAEEPLIGEPGCQVVYSDLGFMLLGFVLERIWDDELDSIAQTLVFSPLKMDATAYRPLETFKDRSINIAATEKGNGFEKNMVLDYLSKYEKAGLPAGSLKISNDEITALDWREGVITGTVHDCNAFYGLDGVSGHAGLFSTVEDLQKYINVWMADDGASFIDPFLRDIATRCHTGRLAPKRALGWEASSIGGNLSQMATGCSGGDLLSKHAFGHTGFTGTSIWCDPDRHAALILLTNRVHPEATDITKWRKAIHNRVFAAFGGSVQNPL